MLASLTELKQYLNIITTTSDDLLNALLLSATDFVQSYACQQFTAATFTDIYNGTGGSILYLKSTPIISVASVIVNGANVPARQVPAASTVTNGYSFDSSCVYLDGYRFFRGHQNIAITYEAGYAVIPPGVKQAVIELAAWHFKESARVGETNKVIGGQTVAFSQHGMSPSTKALLAPYRKRFAVESAIYGG